MSEFSKEGQYETGYLPDGRSRINFPYQYQTSKPYDYDSIMHYDPEAFRNPFKPLRIENVPLVRWKQGGPGYLPPAKATASNADWCQWNSKPLVGNAAMIKSNTQEGEDQIMRNFKKVKHLQESEYVSFMI
jgi:hypothetical protein